MMSVISSNNNNVIDINMRQDDIKSHEEFVNDLAIFIQNNKNNMLYEDDSMSESEMSETSDISETSDTEDTEDDINEDKEEIVNDIAEFMENNKLLSIKEYNDSHIDIKTSISIIERDHRQNHTTEILISELSNINRLFIGMIK